VRFDRDAPKVVASRGRRRTVEEAAGYGAESANRAVLEPAPARCCSSSRSRWPRTSKIGSAVTTTTGIT